MYRYLKPKAGKAIPKPKKRRRGLGDFTNGTRFQKNTHFRRRGSLMDSFTRGKQGKRRANNANKPKTSCRANAIAAAAQKTALGVVAGAAVNIEILVVARDGQINGTAGTIMP